MSKLMEECHDLTMGEKGWLICFWLVKVSHHSSSWEMDLAVNLGSHLKRESSSMTILVLPWEKIKIELSKNLTRSFISNLVGLNLLVPG
jgi:hypothetical protein